ncbi:MAG: hypothetical protein NT004_17560 [Bacteroidetes bacterium]|nr:hypothetical protein [Bacteroidota bacterium]
MIKDVRDDKTYQTFNVGTGENSRCWTAVNLGYGAFTNQLVPQTDNCLPEKYCRNNESSLCDSSGGFYQWDEMMQYQQTGTYQDLCMPGWHVATTTEWQMLIDFSLGNGIAGNFLKDMLPATGFHGVPYGVYYMNNAWSHFSGSDQGTMYWTAEPITTNSAVARGLNTINSGVSFYPSSRANAFPVRCVKNLTP